jgi:hypothetical protein
MDLLPATTLDGNKSAMDILGYGLSATHLDANAGPATRLACSRGLTTFGCLVEHVCKLPYGRNSDRTDWMLVLPEQQGTCSTKHAFLAAVGRENRLDVRLVLLVYVMDQDNTPGISSVLLSNGLSSLPEAHCLLRTPYGLIDATHPPHPRIGPPGYPLHAEEIEPDGIGAHKVAIHKKLLSSCLAAHQVSMTLTEAWSVREACIAALSTRDR